jgi:pimeloyl-ACP methyl ester carboxylesterase
MNRGTQWMVTLARGMAVGALAVMLAACAGSKAPMAERGAQKIVFGNADMDYYLSWILGREIFEGSDRQECMEAATRIVDGDPRSWSEEWERLAGTVEADADAFLAQGRREEARRAYLRACTYHRAPLFVADPDADGFRPAIRRMQECFAKAALLFDPPMERVSVPYAGKMMAGWMWKPDSSGERRPSLLIVGGMETWVEDDYFFTGRLATERGYNVIAVDLPGQGMNPDQGLFLESRADMAVKALLDYVVQRTDVDTDRIALLGMSWGGYIVLKGAQNEPRLAAVIADPATPDMWSFARSQQSGVKGDAIKTAVFKQLAWRYGMRISDFFGRIRLALDWKKNGKADPSRISCPVLCIAGEGESAEAQQQARECYERAVAPGKKLVLFTKADGSAAHCQVDNLGILNRVALDWLADVMDAR